MGLIETLNDEQRENRGPARHLVLQLWDEMVIRTARDQNIAADTPNQLRFICERLGRDENQFRIAVAELRERDELEAVASGEPAAYKELQRVKVLMKKSERQKAIDLLNDMTPAAADDAHHRRLAELGFPLVYERAAAEHRRCEVARNKLQQKAAELAARRHAQEREQERRDFEESFKKKHGGLANVDHTRFYRRPIESAAPSRDPAAELAARRTSEREAFKGPGEVINRADLDRRRVFGGRR